MGKALVLLTGTTTPASSVHKLNQTDPSERLKSYIQSVTWWGKTADRNGLDVCLADNSPNLSKSSVASLKNAMLPNSRLVRAPTQSTVDYPVQKGKGEALLLDHVIASLDAPDNTVIVKCTGRLQVKNFDACYSHHKPNAMTCALRSNLQLSDSRFFIVTKRQWLNWFTSMDQEIDELQGFYFEHVFARRILRALSEGVPFNGMEILPRFLGHSGSTGIRYDGWSNDLKRQAHELIRMCLHRVSYIL